MLTQVECGPKFRGLREGEKFNYQLVDRENLKNKQTNKKHPD